MERFDTALAAFSHAIERARSMIRLFEALELIRSDPTNEDALRAAYFQSVSSLDFFIHEIIIVETEHRIRNSFPTRNVQLPMDFLHITDIDTRVESALSFVRESNGYKAFVDPAKLAQALSCYCDDPWSKIEEKYAELHGEAIPSKTLKAQLNNIWKRRNKIAHEADVNPVLAGVSLWPIDKFDTEFTVTFIERLGVCVPGAIATLLT